MRLGALVPGWVRDARRDNRDTRAIEKTLSDHVATLRGLTVLLEEQVASLKTSPRL